MTSSRFGMFGCYVSRNRDLPRGVQRFLELPERCWPFSEVFYYSEPDLLNLPRYEVEFEIKIFYLLLQQIERLYKGFCYCSVFINI